MFPAQLLIAAILKVRGLWKPKIRYVIVKKPAI
jgi:hypothetical protein